jgi:Protein of unknown function (DUF3300)
MAAFAAMAALAGAASAQQQPQQQEQQLLTDAQVQQLVSPIALYPDSLLAQVLTASTYPLEVVMAARWSKENPNVKGQALEDAMRQQPWEESVKGLTSVPDVLFLMSDKLDWTQQLGEAFLAQPDDITKAVQVLRARAEAAGNLKPDEHVKVIKKPPPPGYAGPAPEVVYYIEPVQPEVYYVPVYDPIVVFGVGYWSTIYIAPPFFWYPVWWTPGPIWGWGPAFFVGPAVWCGYHWYSGGVVVNTVLFSKFSGKPHPGGPQFQKVSFHPEHRGGVPFKNQSLHQQYGKLGGGPGGPKGGTPKSLKGSTLSSTGGGTGGGPKGSGPKGGGAKGGGAKGGKTTSLSSTGTGTGHKTGGSGGSKGSKTFSSTNVGGGTGTGHKTGGTSGGPKSFKGSTYGSTGGGTSGGPKGGGPKSFSAVGGGGGPKTFTAGGGGGNAPRGGGGGPPPKHH